ncbi:LytR family transcriptional regulator [Cohnella sp. CFH 77786]|uniref:LCP family protein n=1 Tax=Cohnella sp. CFH 77786 TaxID=2662265 RepID=UPI001C60DCE8|nr:LCP family protein [Cohnella sp. CFH 77786]MBW5445662.1 LytR family transcriptional regulator [Cohnella sp. CFH 77786]
MRKKWKWILTGTLTVVIAVIGLAVWKGYQTYDQLDQMSKPQDQSRFRQFERKPEYKPLEWTGSERVNVLLLGGDERGLQKGEVARSDSIMVVSFDPGTKRVHLFSVLRDTYVDIPDHRQGRINTAITLGGPELAMKTVGNLLGLDIQYYAYVDFQGFIQLVDAIGGIDFYVEKDMHYTSAADDHKFDIDLKKGQQHLDGEKALQYVRFRHDAMSDFTRTERQRNFLKAVADKLQSGWNLIRLPDILSKMTPYVETNMSPEDMIRLASLGYKSHQAGSAQIPPMELVYDKNVDGSAMIGIKDTDALKGYVQATLAQDTTQPSPSPSASASPTSGDAAAPPAPSSIEKKEGN